MRISMKAFFGWVAFAAVAIAALTQSSVLWLRISFSAALIFTAYAVLAALVVRGDRRPFWIGAAVVSVGYFLVFTGWPDNADSRRLLLTQQLLEWIVPPKNSLFDDPFASDDLWNDGLFDESGLRRTHGGVIALPRPFGIIPVSILQDVEPSGSDDGELKPVPPPAEDPFDSPVYPRTTTPTLPSITAVEFSVGRTRRFYVIAHSIFVILFGIAGGGAAHRIAAANFK